MYILHIPGYLPVLNQFWGCFSIGNPGKFQIEGHGDGPHRRWFNGRSGSNTWRYVNVPYFGPYFAYWCVLRREWMGCWGLLGLLLIVIVDHSLIPC